jgi:hypothetical protein
MGRRNGCAESARAGIQRGIGGGTAKYLPRDIDLNVCMKTDAELKALRKFRERKLRNARSFRRPR